MPPKKIVFGIAFVLLLLGPILFVLIIGPKKLISSLDDSNAKRAEIKIPQAGYWKAPDSTSIPNNTEGDEIRYGRDLIVNTAKYLGPNGKVMAISNGMNCQNCHLDAGTKIYGNNYGAVASLYPKHRDRSGSEETIEKRVNDCIQRSLNGKPLTNESREMRAVVSYIKWVGKDVPKGESPKGVGLLELKYLETAADPTKGQLVYEQHCAQCHGKRGKGIAKADSTGWLYPPLWGNRSYNDGAGLYRLSRMAGYVKANMPLGRAFDKPQLTDEESWNVAAYINAMPRHTFDKSQDWPNISTKPIDHPFGPYTDGFDEVQHKFGPFQPILDKRKVQTSAK